MTDMNKPGAHLQELIELLDSKKRQCWEQSRNAKIRGEVYEECASELRYALEKEAKLAAASVHAVTGSGE